MTALEICANAVNTASVVLAGRNSVHTWWTGILGCLLFAALFVQVKLYADATLQLFFIVTSAIGLYNWTTRPAAPALPVTRTAPRSLVLVVVAGSAVTLGYAALLAAFTDAAAPIPDSAVLAFSVAAQLLLMRRRIETWWFWLLVNTIAVPLYFSRDLVLTAALYAAFWVNALVALRHWRRLVAPTAEPA